MRQMIIAGNWKMNGTKTSAESLLNGIREAHFSNLELVVFPPYVYLGLAQRLLTGTTVKWGAQNMSAEEEGAFTGEISASMLLDFGCRYVLVGHSERRSLYHETDEMIAAKFARAIEAGLKPILCVGEQLAEREAGKTSSIIRKQMQAILDLPSGMFALANAVIAYEPVWAIGTGLTATPLQAQEIHAAIRGQVAEYSQAIAENLTILYGGSVKPENAAKLLSMTDIDGALVGGASLQIKSFLEIAKSCNN